VKEQPEPVADRGPQFLFLPRDRHGLDGGGHRGQLQRDALVGMHPSGIGDLRDGHRGEPALSEPGRRRLEQPGSGALAPCLGRIALASEVADSVSQLDVIHPYLPTHWWLSFDSLLRVPIVWPELGHGLLSFAVYIVIFCSIAWARFTAADVTS
jgi:hypothetical protein